LGFLDLCGLDAVAQIREHRHDEKEGPRDSKEPVT